MKPVQLQMLESLASGVRPVDLGEHPIQPGDGFDTMLRDTLNGQFRSQLGVKFAPSASGLFDPAEQDQIARALDIAAAAGSREALILHDRHTLRVDVRNRVVLDAHFMESGSLTTEIDAFVCAQASNLDARAEETQQIVPGVSVPARIVRNASLARTLAQTSDAVGL